MLSLALLSMLGCADRPYALQFRGDPPKNLLMVSIDTLRKDRLGRYDSKPSEDSVSPWLDELMEESLVLDKHRSCSNWTYGSVVCAMSGRTGSDVGFVPGGADSRAPLPGDSRVLPVLLNDRGFKTGLVTTNPYLGKTAGFDRFYDLFYEEDGAAANAVVDKGLNFYDQLKGDDPWYLHLHLIDPHAGYNPPERFLKALEQIDPIPVDLSVDSAVRGLEKVWDTFPPHTQELILEHIRIRYEGEVSYIDEQIQRLMALLDQQDALDDTLVVIWSDHGEQFFEHGQFTHGNNLHSEEVDAMALFWAKNVRHRSWPELTRHSDIVQTIIYGMDLPRAAGITGRAVGSGDVHRPAYATRRDEVPIQSVEQDGERLVYDWSGELSYYDLDADPGGATDQFEALEGEDVERLWKLLSFRVEKLDALIEDATPIWPEGTSQAAAAAEAAEAKRAAEVGDDLQAADITR